MKYKSWVSFDCKSTLIDQSKSGSDEKYDLNQSGCCQMAAYGGCFNEAVAEFVSDSELVVWPKG